MSQLIIFIIGFIIGAVVGGSVAWILFYKNQKEALKEAERLKKEMDKEKQEFSGLEEYNKKTAEIKEERKQKILSQIRESGKTDAGKIADLLNVSRYTAFRYLEELEKQGKIEQVGAVGRGVEYKLK